MGFFLFCKAGLDGFCTELLHSRVLRCAAFRSAWIIYNNRWRAKRECYLLSRFMFLCRVTHRENFFQRKMHPVTPEHHPHSPSIELGTETVVSGRAWHGVLACAGRYRRETRDSARFLVRSFLMGWLRGRRK